MISIVSLNPSIDKFISVDNFTCGRTNHVQTTRLKAGGKGTNSALAAAKLGVQTEIIGFCALSAGIIEQKLEREHVRYELIPAFNEIRENIKISDRKHKQITEINQKGRISSSQAVSRVISLCIEAARRSSYLIMAGSVPDGCPKSIYGDIISEIKNENIPCKCVVDSSGAPLRFAIQSKPYLIKPNLQELEQLSGRKLPSIEDIKQAAASIIDDGVSIVLVSMGCEGALLCTKDGSCYAPALVCEVANEVGAGDSMLAAMVCALDSGHDLISAFACSMAASAASVSSEEGIIADIGLYEDFLHRVIIEKGE